MTRQNNQNFAGLLGLPLALSRKYLKKESRPKSQK
jgi:hypothetical protein